MCCFSRPVQSVSATSIFARPLDDGRQALAYAMSYRATEDLALVLPIPLPVGADEQAVRWLDLSRCPDLFRRLAAAFPSDLSRSRAAPQPAARNLQVVRVGSFEASFAPSAADLARLDPRFRLPTEVLSSLPALRDRGFVVARLRPDATSIHPLAFTWPRRDPTRLFFPTLHVHDGRVHPAADFDHTLIAQAHQLPTEAPSERPSAWDRVTRLLGGPPPLAWERAIRPAGELVEVDSTAGLVDAALPCARLRLRGRFGNGDVEVVAA